MAASEVFVQGDRVRVHLKHGYWRATGWFEGVIVRIDAYTTKRSFYWVELDEPVETAQGGRTSMVSILNPKHIVRA